jgi:hypothetical protein
LKMKIKDGRIPKRLRDNFKVGDLVRVNNRVEASYSGYGGNPECYLEPDVIATVKAVNVPWVTLPANGLDSFVQVEFEGPEYGIEPHVYTYWRAAVCYTNLQKVNMSQIKAGTEVTWTSQAQGNSTKKVGKVLSYIPRGESAALAYNAYVESLGGNRLEFRPFKQLQIQEHSKVNRYLVLVTRVGKNGKMLKGKLYTPSAGVLEAQNPGKQEA